MLYRQIQNGPFEIDRAGNGARLVMAVLPGLSLRNVSNNIAGAIGGTAPNGNFVGDGPFGRDLMIHPNGSTDGVGGLRFDRDTASGSDDWTLIWVGRPQNYTTSNGSLMVRGADGAGNGWNLHLTYELGPVSGTGSGNLVARCVDTSPAAFTATISSLTLATDQHERVALVKRGNTIKVFNWRTRQMVSASAGNGALRTSTSGVGLGFSTTNSTSGHNKVNTALAYSFGMPDSEVWATLDNPWEDFEPDSTIFRIAGGATDTPINPANAASVSKGNTPTLTQTANQSLIPSNARGSGSSYAPTLLRTANQSLSPANASSASGTYAPTVTQAVTLTLTPGTATGATQGYAPTISATANQFLVPAAGTGAAKGYAPSILQPQALSPTNGTGAAAGYAPSVTQAITTTIQPFAGTLSSNGYSLSITQSNNVQVQPGAGNGALVGAVPLVVQTTAKSLVPDAGAGAFKGYAPTITQFDPTTDARYARPASDVSQGCWLPSVPAATLASMIDEVTPSSADYIYATAACTCEVKLNPVVDPQTSSGQVVRYQAWSPEGNGVTVTLKQGATTIASWSHPVLPLTATIYAQTLTVAQCDSITDYADLRFVFSAA